MNDNELYVRVWKYVFTAVVCVAATVGVCNIAGDLIEQHTKLRSLEVETSPAGLERSRNEAQRAQGDSMKAMWDHVKPQ